MNTWGRHGRENIVSLRKRFSESTKSLPNGCVVWTGAIGSHGRYGICRAMGRHWLAHRLAYTIFVSEIPDGMNVCHHCDNGLCVRPEHLFLGTQKDNVHDMENKLRSKHPSGAAHGRAKLTESDVSEIRSLGSAGLSQREIAKKFGVSKFTIARIVNGKGWITKPSP